MQRVSTESLHSYLINDLLSQRLSIIEVYAGKYVASVGNIRVATIDIVRRARLQKVENALEGYCQYASICSYHKQRTIAREKVHKSST